MVHLSKVFWQKGIVHCRDVFYERPKVILNLKRFPAFLITVSLLSLDRPACKPAPSTCWALRPWPSAGTSTWCCCRPRHRSCTPRHDTSPASFKIAILRRNFRLQMKSFSQRFHMHFGQAAKLNNQLTTSNTNFLTNNPFYIFWWHFNEKRLALACF